MESLLVEQSFTPRKQIKNPKWKTHQHVNNPYNHHHQIAQLSNNNSISRQGSLTQNYAPPSPPPPQPPQVMINEFDLMMMKMHGGFFFNNTHHAPPYHHQHHHLHASNSLPPMHLSYHPNHHHQPPPLLPPPAVSRPAFRSLPPHISKKTPTKPKPPQKKENKKNNNNSVQLNSAKSEKTMVINTGPTKESGPDPGALAKDLTRMLLADLDAVAEMDKFSGSVFSLAPPPSSLPLPKFTLRQPPRCKLSCKAEAAADVGEVVDGGASDNICKILKLR